MPTPTSREKDKMDYTPTEGLDGQIGKTPAYQSEETFANEEYTTIPAIPTPNLNSFQDGREIHLDLEPNDCGEIKNMEIRFTLSSAAGVTLVPGYHLIRRIIIEANKSMGDELCQVYPISMLLYQYLTENQDQVLRNQHHSGYQLVDYAKGEKQRIWYGPNTTLAPGETRDFYLPIPVNFFQMGVLDMSHIVQTIRFRIDLNPDIDAVNGGAGDVQLTDLNLIARGVRTMDKDEREKRARMRSGCHKYVYLDVDRLIVNDKNLQAGERTLFPLDHFAGDCSFMAVVFKNTTAPSGKDDFDYYEIGWGDANFDITNSSGRSDLGNGTPVPAEQLMKHWCDETGQPPLAGVYVIPFGESLHDAVMGRRNGHRKFYGQKDFLEVRFSNQGRAETYVGSKTAAFAGTAWVSVGTQSGLMTNEILDGLTVAANGYDFYFREIPEVEQKQYSFVGDDVLTNANPVTFTFDQYRNGNVSKDIGELRLQVNSADGADITISKTQDGRIGWESSSDRTCEIYMFKFKELDISPDGVLTCRDFLSPDLNHY